jgi:dUTP pyrophosphatase
MTTVTLKQTANNARLPARATEGAFGYDLATIQDERIGGRETRVLPCGYQLAHDLPRDETGGLAMLVLPRSSLPLKYGLILPNAPGLIDADYSEPIGIIVHNLRDESVALSAGTRVAQAVFVELRFPRLDVVESADPTRDRGGFGSTGT